eukprot:NODE_1_length_95616_cov_0.657642.p40 type:complete len:255 gc:universal NODE_1_length_95616_cov_0.657642:76737-75973(-)
MALGLMVPKNIPTVKRVIGVLSGKGGVGKSCVTACLAHTLPGRVGILDADVYGPSIPKIMNLSREPEIDDTGRMIPLKNHGIQFMSMGLFSKKAVVWRGLMVMKAVQDLIWHTKWSDLDYLLIDFPPGTGDAQLTVVQQLNLHGCVVVSTPQSISIIDAQKAVQMLEKVKIPLLGMVKNMSTFQCPSCSKLHSLFPDANTEFWKRSEFLASLPFDPRISENMDKGSPILSDLSNSIFSKEIQNLANHIHSSAAQ